MLGVNDLQKHHVIMKQSAGNNNPVDTTVTTFTDINIPAYCKMMPLHNHIRPGWLRGIGVFFTISYRNFKGLRVSYCIS